MCWWALGLGLATAQPFVLGHRREELAGAEGANTAGNPALGELSKAAGLVPVSVHACCSVLFSRSVYGAVSSPAGMQSSTGSTLALYPQCPAQGLVQVGAQEGSYSSS